MDAGDIGAAIRIAFTYFTILYLTGLGDCSVNDRDREHRPRGPDGDRDVTGAAAWRSSPGRLRRDGSGAGGVVLGLFSALSVARSSRRACGGTINFHAITSSRCRDQPGGDRTGSVLSFVFFEQPPIDPGGPHLRGSTSRCCRRSRGASVVPPEPVTVVIFAALLVFP